MKSEMPKVFEFINEAVIALKDGKIEYYNSAAKKLIPSGLENMHPYDIFPAQFLEHDADSFVGSVLIDGKNIGVSVSTQDEYRIYCFMPQESEDYCESDEYLSAVSGALKNALAIWKMSSDLLLPNIENLEDEKLERYAAMMRHSYYIMLRIANNNNYICDIIREDGYMRQNEVDIILMCREIIESLATLLSDRGVILRFESSLNSLFMTADALMIEQMILNILSNSLKFTPPGGKIILSVAMAKERILLSVSDTGKGISPDMLLNVWNKCRLPKNISDNSIGIGTGLPIVQHIARLHGGSAVLESHEDAGTTVTVMLPLAEAKNGGMNSVYTNYQTHNMTQILTELADVLDYKYYSQQYMD